MNTQTYADWSVWSGPFVELQQINQATAEKVIRECISFYSDNTATAVRCTQTMQRVTSPEDFLSTQMKLLSQQGEKTLEFIQNVSKIYQDALKDHCRWTEDKVSTAMKNVGKPPVSRKTEENK